MVPDLECTGLVKDFGPARAVDGVSFAVPPGSFFSILGPSGCGKTTILRMIAGFVAPDEGDILIRGRSVVATAPNRRPVNMVFQHLALFPMMNVGENIAYGLRRAGLKRGEIAAKVEAALERIGLPGVAGRRVDELSGGQKQRIAIARCMVLEPDVLLLDEPLGALDLKLREHMKIELKALQSAFDTTFVYITHDQSEALVMSDQIAVMNAGRFEQVGTAQELYFRPRTPFVAGFVGESNRWTGRIEAAAGAALKVRADSGTPIAATAAEDGLAAGARAEVFVRPEAIRLATGPEPFAHLENRIEAVVTAVLFNGAASRILVRDAATGQELEAALPQSGEFAGLTPGARLHLGWDGAQALAFGARG